jgi:Nucleotidyltransferase domain
MDIIQNKSSWAKVKPEYQNLLLQLSERVKKHFSSELYAYYLLGSVGRGEEISGVSDLDTVILLGRSLVDKDEAWEKEIQLEFEPQYPHLSRLDISCMEEQELNDINTERLRFIFKTDSVLICGQEITSNFSSYPPGLELAKILNADYRQGLETILKDILEPDEEDSHNNNYVMEYVRWLSKKVLRLALGLIMINEKFYTRNIQEISHKFSELYPQYQTQSTIALNQYLQPTNNLDEAITFINEMSRSIYVLADEKLL